MKVSLNRDIKRFDDQIGLLVSIVLSLGEN